MHITCYMYEVLLSLQIAALSPPCVRFVFYGIAEQVNRRSLGSFSKPTFELAEGLERGCVCARACMCVRAHVCMHVLVP